MTNSSFFKCRNMFDGSYVPGQAVPYFRPKVSASIIIKNYEFTPCTICWLTKSRNLNLIWCAKMCCIELQYNVNKGAFIVCCNAAALPMCWLLILPQLNARHCSQIHFAAVQQWSSRCRDGNMTTATYRNAAAVDFERSLTLQTLINLRVTSDSRLTLGLHYMVQYLQLACQCHYFNSHHSNLFDANVCLKTIHSTWINSIHMLIIFLVKLAMNLAVRIKYRTQKHCIILFVMKKKIKWPLNWGSQLALELLL